MRANPFWIVVLGMCCVSGDAVSASPELESAIDRIQQYVDSQDCGGFLSDGVTARIRDTISPRELAPFCDAWRERRSGWQVALKAARSARPRMSVRGDLAFFNLVDFGLPKNLEILQLARLNERWYVDTNRQVFGPDDYAQQPAGKFEGFDQAGERVSLSELRGTWVVLFFYVSDSGPGDIAQAVEFRDEFVKFRQLNARIVGISANTSDDHKRFAKEWTLPYPIIADPRREIIGRYGVESAAKSSKSSYALRTTFIVDPEGVVQHIYYGVNPSGHAQTVLGDLKALQTGQPLKKRSGSLSDFLVDALAGSVQLLKARKCREYLKTYEAQLWQTAAAKDRGKLEQVACRDENRERLIATYETASLMAPERNDAGDRVIFRPGSRMVDPSYEQLVVAKSGGLWSIDSFASFGTAKLGAVYAAVNKSAMQKRSESYEKSKPKPSSSETASTGTGTAGLLADAAIRLFAASKGIDLGPSASGGSSGSASPSGNQPQAPSQSQIQGSTETPVRVRYSGPGCAPNLFYLRPHLHEAIWNEPVGRQTLTQSIDSFIKTPDDIDRQIVAMRIQRDQHQDSYNTAKACADQIAPHGMAGTYPRVVGEPKGGREACLSAMHLSAESILAHDAMIEAYQCRRGQ